MKLSCKVRSARWIALFSVVALVAGLNLGSSCTISPDNPLPVMLDPADVTCGEFTYDNFGKNFFQTYCLRCHSNTLITDAERTDAPQGIDFNTLDLAVPFKNRIKIRAGQLGDMPPILLGGRRPTVEERLHLLEWIECNMTP